MNRDWGPDPCAAMEAHQLQTQWVDTGQVLYFMVGRREIQTVDGAFVMYVVGEKFAAHVVEAHNALLSQSPSPDTMAGLRTPVGK